MKPKLKPKLKPPGTKGLKLNCDTPLSTSAFKFNLRRYTVGGVYKSNGKNHLVGRCRLTLSNPS
jgi:hypothetical protein